MVSGNLITVIGLCAACLTTASFIPQALKTIRSRNTDGLSLVMYVLFVSGLCFWLAYGVVSGDIAIILANAITILLATPVLLIKCFNELRGNPTAEIQPSEI